MQFIVCDQCGTKEPWAKMPASTKTVAPITVRVDSAIPYEYEFCSWECAIAFGYEHPWAFEEKPWGQIKEPVGNS